MGLSVAGGMAGSTAALRTMLTSKRRIGVDAVLARLLKDGLGIRDAARKRAPRASAAGTFRGHVSTKNDSAERGRAPQGRHVSGERGGVGGGGAGSGTLKLVQQQGPEPIFPPMNFIVSCYKIRVQGEDPSLAWRAFNWGRGGR